MLLCACACTCFLAAHLWKDVTLIVVHSSAHYPPDPSGSNASKVVDITGLLVFVGDVITDRFESMTVSQVTKL